MANEKIDWEHQAFHCGGEEIGYVIGRPEKYTKKNPICLIAAHSRKEMFEEPVMLELATALVNAGVTVLSFPSKWGDLDLQSEALRKGFDTFIEIDDRINSVIDACMESNFYAGEKLILLGCSRFGFACLHAMAGNLNIDAVVAILPVTYWPWLREFKGLESNVIVRKHDLASRVENIAGREMLIEIATDDERVSTELALQLADEMKLAYDKVNKKGALTVVQTNVKGHNWTKEINEDVLDWFRKSKYMQ